MKEWRKAKLIEELSYAVVRDKLCLSRGWSCQGDAKSHALARLVKGSRLLMFIWEC